MFLYLLSLRWQRNKTLRKKNKINKIYVYLPLPNAMFHWKDRTIITYVRLINLWQSHFNHTKMGKELLDRPGDKSYLIQKLYFYYCSKTYCYAIFYGFLFFIFVIIKYFNHKEATNNLFIWILLHQINYTLLSADICKPHFHRKIIYVLGWYDFPFSRNI